MTFELLGLAGLSGGSDPGVFLLPDACHFSGEASEAQRM